MKKFLISAILLIAVLFLFLAFLPANYLFSEPDQGAFSLQVKFPALHFRAGEPIPIQAELSNRTFRAYTAFSDSEVIRVSWIRDGQLKKDGKPVINHRKYILPRESVKKDLTAEIREPGNYTVYVEAYMEIGRIDYHYCKSYDVEIQ